MSFSGTGNKILEGEETTYKMKSTHKTNNIKEIRVSSIIEEYCEKI